MYSATHENVTVPLGRDMKTRTALRTNQIAGFVTVLSKKKINGNINSIFFSSEPFFSRKIYNLNKYIKKQFIIGLLTKVNPCIIMQNVSAILLLQYTSTLPF